jgi:hypothetical protein
LLHQSSGAVPARAGPLRARFETAQTAADVRPVTARTLKAAGRIATRELLLKKIGPWLTVGRKRVVDGERLQRAKRSTNLVVTM